MDIKFRTYLLIRNLRNFKMVEHLHFGNKHVHGNSRTEYGTLGPKERRSIFQQLYIERITTLNWTKGFYFSV